jgi:hypothetical protein
MALEEVEEGLLAIPSIVRMLVTLERAVTMAEVVEAKVIHAVH